MDVEQVAIPEVQPVRNIGFVKGDPRINRRGRPKKQPVLPAAVEVTVEDGVPEQLALMRHVLKHPEGSGEAQALGLVRKWAREDPKGFLAAKTSLERMLLSRVVAATEETEVVVEKAEDAGTELCEELIGRLLKEFRDGR